MTEKAEERSDRQSRLSALTILTRLAQRGHADEWLRRGLSERLGSLAPIALDVAVETGDPIGRILAEELEKAGDGRILVQLYLLSNNNNYRDSLALHEVNRVVDGAILSDFVDVQDMPDSSPSGLCELSRLLISADRLEEAVSVAERAVQAAKHGHQEHIALALSHLGAAQNLAGLSVEAMQNLRKSTNLYRKHATAGEPRWMAELARGLEDLAFSFGATCQHGKAEIALREALEIYRRLGCSRPTMTIAEESSGVSEHNHGLAESGDSESPYRRTVSRYVDLTHEWVSPLDQLARAWRNLGVALFERDRSEEAIAATREAAKILRELVEARPDRSERPLAEALGQLAFQLDASGLSTEGLAPAQESYEIFRRLAKERPGLLAENLRQSSALLKLIKETLRQKPIRES